MRSLGTPLAAEGGVLSAQEAPPAARPESHGEQTNRPPRAGGRAQLLGACSRPATRTHALAAPDQPLRRPVSS